MIYDILNSCSAAPLLLGLGSTFAVYYACFVSKRPQIFCSDSFKQFLSATCPVLNEKFWPTFWCFRAIPQTILRAVIKSAPPIKYRKEFIDTPDGGHLALDWKDNDNSEHEDPMSRPTVLILPGLTGSSQETYALHFVEQASALGYRCVVFNYRGFGGAELKTPRSYCASNTDDLAHVVQHIKTQYPNSPVIAAGVSLGGIKTFNYLAKMGTESGVVAAMINCTPWDMFSAKDSLEAPVNKYVFNTHLANNLKEAIKRHRHLFEDTHDLEYVFKSVTIREFDDRFTAKMFGYPSWKEYYEDASMHKKLDKIQVPLLCLNAADDPFSPEYALPVEAATKSKYVSMVVTRHGGHIGYLEGIVPRHAGYMDRLFAQYIHACFQNVNDLQKIVAP